VLKPRWLVMSLLELVAAELRLYQQSVVFGLAHHLSLVFLMVFIAILLEDRP
jgi:hypothetical protein